MHCIRCGNALTAFDTECPRCKYPVQQPPAGGAPPEPPQVQVQPDYNQYPPTPPQSYPPYQAPYQPPQPPPNNSGRVLANLGIVAIFGILACCGGPLLFVLYFLFNFFRIVGEVQSIEANRVPVPTSRPLR